MTSRCAEPDAGAGRFRTNPLLLVRDLPDGALVCLPATSVYQDVRVLRLDALAGEIVAIARTPAGVADVAHELVRADGAADGASDEADGAVDAATDVVALGALVRDLVAMHVLVADGRVLPVTPAPPQ